MTGSRYPSCQQSPKQTRSSLFSGQRFLITATFRSRKEVRWSSSSSNDAFRRSNARPIGEFGSRSCGGHASNANRIRFCQPEERREGRRTDRTFPMELFVQRLCIFVRSPVRPHSPCFPRELARLRNFRFGLIQFSKSFDFLADVPDFWLRVSAWNRVPSLFSWLSVG